MYTQDTTTAPAKTGSASQDLSTLPLAIQQKIEDCKTLYIAYQGRHHEAIEREMRSLGHQTFSRRILYTRNQRGQRTPGWPEKYGWDKELGKQASERHTGCRSTVTGQEGGLPPLKLVPDLVATELKSGDVERGRAPFPTYNSDLATNSGTATKPDDSDLAAQLQMDPGGFRAWLRRTFPHMQWHHKHIEYVCDILEKVTRGEIKRLMIFMPPRHGKSELVTQKYAAWRLKQDPKLRVIIGSHNQTLATEFSVGIKRALEEDALLKDEGGRMKELRKDEGARRKDESPHDKRTCAFCRAHPGPEDCPTLSNYLAADTVLSKLAALLSSLTSSASQTASTSQTFLKARRVNRGSQWQTAAGGGVRAVGVGGGITGFGGDLIIIDDPVKGREVAESRTFRRKLWKWFTDDLSTRKQPDAQVILIQTRWHEDDLAGHILRDMQENPDAEQWTVIDLPALAEPSSMESGEQRKRPFVDDEYEPQPPVKEPIYIIMNGERVRYHAPGSLKPEYEHESERGHPCPPVNPLTSLSADAADLDARAGKGARVPTDDWRDVLGRKRGEPLCRDWFSEAALHHTRRQMGTYSWSAMYQQRPVPAEGGIFKRSWFPIVKRAPENLRWKRGYDLGLSASATSDFTATAKIGFDHDGNMYITDVFRRQMDYPEQKRAILGLIVAEPNVEHIIEESANGSAVLQDLRRETIIRGRRLRGLRVKENKIARTFGWNALAESGKVFLVEGPWNEAFIEEACSFPNGANDDQIDAVSLAVKMYNEKKASFHAF